MIPGKAFPRIEEVGHTLRADGKRDTHYRKVLICGNCDRKANQKAKVKAMARAWGVMVIGLVVGGFASPWLLEKIGKARSQPTAPETAVAPKGSAPKPRLILIPPENPPKPRLILVPPSFFTDE
jgi:hypothetical protein